MVFKSTAYRLGYGKNIRGIYNDGKFIVYYKSRDGVVNTKIITRRAGRVDLEKGSETFNATTVLPFLDGFILSRVDTEVKAIKSEI